jgi:hypothetical protein
LLTHGNHGKFVAVVMLILGIAIGGLNLLSLAQTPSKASLKVIPPRVLAYLDKREVKCGDKVTLTGLIAVLDPKLTSLQTVRVKVHRLAAFHHKTAEKLYLDNTHHRYIVEVHNVFPDLEYLTGASRGIVTDLSTPGEMRYTDQFIAQRAGVYLIELSCALYIKTDNKRNEVKLSADPIMLTVEPKRNADGKLILNRESMSGITEKQQADFEADGNAKPDD